MSHAPRGSYLLVEVSQSHLRNASAASNIRKRSAVRNRLGTPRAWRRPLHRSHTGRRTTGDNLVAPALDSISPQTVGGQNRRERFRELSIGLRSKVSKCFGTPPVCEANHIADRLQSSCRNDSLPNRHTRRVQVAEWKRLDTNVTDSRVGKEFARLVRPPSESNNSRAIMKASEAPPRRRAKLE